MQANLFQRFSPESLQVLVQIKTVYFKDDYCYDEMIRSQFKMIRNSQTNGVDLRTFRDYIHNKTENVSDRLIDDMFCIFDKNGSGLISEGEFSHVFQMIRTMTLESLQNALNQRQSQSNLNGGSQQFNVNCVVKPNANNGPTRDPANNQKVAVHINIPGNMSHNNLIITPPPGTTVTQLIVNNQDMTKAINTPQQQQPPLVGNPLADPQQKQQEQNQNAQITKNKYPQLPNQQSQQNLANNQQGYQQQQFQQPNQQQIQQQQRQQMQQQQQQYPNMNVKQNTIDKPKYPSLDINQKNEQTNSAETATGGGGIGVNNGNMKGLSREETNRIVNGLINPIGADASDDVFKDVDFLRSLNKQDAERFQQKEMVDPVNTMVIKLAELKNRHLKGEVDVVSNLKQFSPSGNMSFEELIFFFESLGINFTPQEKDVIKAQGNHSGSGSKSFITSKEFLAFIRLKDYFVPLANPKYVPQKQQIFVPQQQQQQQQRQQEQQNAQRRMQPQEQQNFLQVNQVQQQDQYGQQIDLLKSSIQTKFYFEKENLTLKGYKEFITIFKNVDQTKQPFSDKEFKAVNESIVTDPTSSLYGKMQQF